MRSHRYRKWRPLAGIVALGLFAFGWSLHGAAEEREQPTVQAGARAAAVVNISDESTPAAAGCGSGVPKEPLIVADSPDGIILTRGAPVTGDVPVFGATEFGEKSSGVAGRGRTDCICDLDCEDGDPCTYDWCDEIPPEGGVGVCNQNTVDAEGLDCEDAGVYCSMGSCDTAGNCVEDAGGSPCDLTGYCLDDPDLECEVDQDCVDQGAAGPCYGEEVCNETDDRCEDQECADTAGCDDGEYCNGEEICDAVLQCVDRKWCTHNDAVCTDDSDCVGQGVCSSSRCPRACGDDGCDEDTDTCGTDDIGRCCSGTEGYETCDDTLTLAQCDAVPGIWDCENGCGYCEGDPYTVCHDDDECEWDTVPCVIVGCPPYSSGWVPRGEIIYDVGPIQNQPCTDYYRVGDDYTLANGSEYMELRKFRFVGGVEVAPTTVVFEFWDNAATPVEVNAFALTFNTAGNWWWTITMGQPILIPPQGYVTLRVAEDDLGSAHWLSTDEVDVGDNNAALLWANDVRAEHLPDDPDILAFEMSGEVAPGLYSCCDELTGDCTLATPWDCSAAGDTSLYLDGETTCDPNPCADGACCLADGSCIVTVGQTECTTAGGEWDKYGSDCEPNCCRQAEPYSGDDDCDGATLKANRIQVPTNTEICYADADCDWEFNNERCIGELGVDSMCTVQITISGDNTSATTGECNPTGDLGWYEAFNLVDEFDDPAECASVTMDECCTFDPVTGDVPGAGYIILYRGCSEAADYCGGTVYSDEYGRSPFCGPDDNNIWNIWEAIPGGSYHYPILSDDTGVDYPSTLFPYQVHIAVTACPLKACCTPPLAEGTPAVRCAAVTCVLTNKVACDAAEGWFNEDEVICWGDDTCGTGACCTSPGVCEEATPPNACVNCLSTGPAAEYFGGASCDDNPCPVCPWVNSAGIADPDFCIEDRDGLYGVYVARSRYEPGEPYTRYADDFIADSTGSIDRICWWPGFSDPYHSVPCDVDPPSHGIDDTQWKVVIYEDNFGIPGDEIFNQLVTPDAKAHTGYWVIWEYSAPLVSGPDVIQGNCYWIEITGWGDPDGCEPLWLTSCAGNTYSVMDSTGEWDHGDITWLIGAGTSDQPYDGCTDFTFCVDVGVAGSCGPMPGACMYCGEEAPACADGICSNDPNEYKRWCDVALQDCPAAYLPCVPMGFDDCRGEWQASSDPVDGPDGLAYYPYMDCAVNNGLCDDGTWCNFEAQDCAEGPCTSIIPPPIVGDNCETNAIHIHDGGAKDLCPDLPCTVPFSNVCASVDGFVLVTPCAILGDRWAYPTNPVAGDRDAEFGTDIWYEFHADPGQCGDLLLNFCEDYTYDGIVAVYGIPSVGAKAPLNCPTDGNDGLVACGDDTCGSYEGMPILPWRSVDPGPPEYYGENAIHICGDLCLPDGESCHYLIRVAGWMGNQGSGKMKISFVEGTQVCEFHTNIACSLDEDCPTGRCIYTKVCEDNPEVLCDTNQVCIDAGAGDVCTPCDPRICEVRRAMRPMAEDCATIAPGTRCSASGTCTVDADCTEESHCVLAPADQPDLDNVCYAPKTRYLSIARNPEQMPNTARRVKLDDGTELGWVGAPTQHPATGLWLAHVVSESDRVYQGQWPDVVHVMGCEIAHASLSNVTERHCKPNPIAGETCVEHCYIVQAMSEAGDITIEGDYSDELTLCTNSTWGDTCSAPSGLLLPADGIPGLADIMGVIAYFQGDYVAPLTWLDIDSSVGAALPDQAAAIGDIMSAIAGYQGSPYPGLGPKNCP